MSFQLSAIDVTANTTFGDLIQLANTIVNSCATEVVSANTAANGALTIGNGYVSGIFGGTKIVATNLFGGSVQTPANVFVSCNLVANLTLQANLCLVYGNTFVNSTFINTTSFTSNAASITYLLLEQIQMGNTVIADIFVHQGVSSPLLFDNWLMSGFRSAEYFISLSDFTANNHGCTKLSVVQGNGTVLVTEYGQLYTNGSPFGVFSANANATHVTVWFTTGGTANANITATKTTLRL